MRWKCSECEKDNNALAGGRASRTVKPVVGGKDQP